MRIPYFILLALGVLLSTSVKAQRNKNPYKDKGKTIIVDERNQYDSSKDVNKNKLMLKDTLAAADFATYVEGIPTIKKPYQVDEKSDKRKFRAIDKATYDKYFDVVNGLGEQILVEPSRKGKSLYLIGKLDGMPEGIHALLFYAYDGAIYQYTKLITFNKEGYPIAHQNVQFSISSGNADVKQATKMSCSLNADNTMNCITYGKDDADSQMIKKEGVIYGVQPDGTIKEVGLVDLTEDNDN